MGMEMNNNMSCACDNSLKAICWLQDYDDMSVSKIQHSNMAVYKIMVAIEMCLFHHFAHYTDAFIYAASL